MDELLLRLAKQGSAALWPLLLLRNGDQVPKDSSSGSCFKADASKVKGAKRVIEKIRKVPAVRPAPRMRCQSSLGRCSQVLEAVEVLSSFYLNVAFYPVDKRLVESSR